MRKGGEGDGHDLVAGLQGVGKEIPQMISSVIERPSLLPAFNIPTY
jgi:hypothetical protein